MSNAQVDIELVDEGQAEALAQVHAAAFGERAWSAQEIASLLRQEGTEALLARDGSGNPCGMILYRLMADEGEILTLGVAPAFRRQGIGGRLLATALTALMMLGAGRVFLEVGENNAAARALYEGMAFEVVGRRPGYYGRMQGTEEDALIMVRHFSAGCGECD